MNERSENTRNTALTSRNKPYVVRKLIDFITGIHRAFRKRNYYLTPTITKEQYDRQGARLGARIELHMDDEAWLLQKLGIDHRLVRAKNGYINRSSIERILEEKPGV